MTTHLDETREIADELNTRVSDLLDIGDIPKGSPTEVRAERVLAAVYDVLNEIPRAARNASALQESGPIVYPVHGTDMRKWGTSDGRAAGKLLTGRTASRVASARTVVPGPQFTGRRALTWSQYHRALENAQFQRSPLRETDDRTSYVTVSR